MFYSLRLYWRDKWILSSSAVICVLQIFIWWTLLRAIRPTDEQIFLHYNIILGVDKVGEWWNLYLLPLGGLLILALNTAASFVFYRADRLAARTLSILGATAHVLLAIAVVLLVRLNV